MPKGAILCDVCSVKVNPLAQMLEAYDGPVVGTHPLFGPEPKPEDPLRVAVMRRIFRAQALLLWLCAGYFAAS